MKEYITIGLGQLLVEGGEPNRNFERAEIMIKEASKKNCDLILLPECMDLGWTHPSAKSESLPIPGLYSNKVSKLAKDNNIYICCGLTEKDEKNNKVYNSSIICDNLGEIICKYRKINILEEALDYYSIGKSLSVVETSFGNIGLNICSDNYANSLEIGKTLGRMGAKIILSPSSWTVDYNITEESDPYGEKWIKPYHTLAQIFDLVVVSTTSVGYLVGGPFEGRKMVGCSVVVNKEGVQYRGKFNEIAGDLGIQEIKIPKSNFKGTLIDKRIKDLNIK
mgnify:FL=1